MWVIQSMLLSMMALLLRGFGASHSPYRMWLMVPVAFLAMGLRQSQNLLFGWQIGFGAVAASAIAAIYCLYRMNGPRSAGVEVPAAIAFATVSTCSGGLRTPGVDRGSRPAGMLPMSHGAKPCFCELIVLGAIQWVLYFCGLSTPA